VGRGLVRPGGHRRHGGLPEGGATTWEGDQDGSTRNSTRRGRLVSTLRGYSYPPTIAWIDSFIFGSHTPVDQDISKIFAPVSFPLLAPNKPVRLNFTLNWYRGTAAVLPNPTRVFVKANGVYVANNPGGLVTDPDPAIPYVDTACDERRRRVTSSSGSTTTTGLGRCRLGATLGEASIADLTCEPTTVSYRLDFPYPIEELALSAPRASSDRSTCRPRSDRLARGHDGVLEGEVPWIPASVARLPLNDGGKIAMTRAPSGPAGPAFVSAGARRAFDFIPTRTTT
jgi:hypothetical protein